MNCPKCGSENISTERRMYGFRTCLDCNYKWANLSKRGYIVYTSDEPRGYKHCMCCVCGKISTCTPSNDFYTTIDHGNKLVCERCFSEYVGYVLSSKAENLEIKTSRTGEDE